MTTVSQIIQRDAPGYNDITEVEGPGGEFYSDLTVMNHSFWINDLLFKIPPSQIISQSEDSIKNWQGLRTSSSTKIHSGNGNRMFLITADIPSKSAIKNVDLRIGQQRSTDNNTGKRGGLLDLIIQFKNIPFARVENAFLRSQLRIPKERNMVFCMHSLNLNTIEGEPGTVRVTMLITVLNYSPYSDRWGYREDWKSQPRYGSFRFDDANLIDLPGRARYGTISAGEDNRVDRNIMSPGVRESGQDTEADLVVPVEFNIDFTESDNSLWGSERQYMEQPIQVMNPSFSSVYKDYIDWLHYQWTLRKDIESPGGYDCTKVSPYGEDVHSLGDEVILEWSEYKDFDMPRYLQDRLRAGIRQRALQISEGITGRQGNPIAAPQSRDGEVVDALAGGSPETWVSSLATGLTGRFEDRRGVREDDPSTEEDESNPGRLHMGLDLRFPAGTPTYSIWDGIVVGVSPYTYPVESPRRNMDYGGSVTIRSSENPDYEIFIRHIKDVVVSRGQQVRRGELIGVSYYADPNREVNTLDGKEDEHLEYIRDNRMPGSDRSHLHIELEINGEKEDPVEVDLRGLVSPNHIPNQPRPPGGSEPDGRDFDFDISEIFEFTKEDIPEFANFVLSVEAQGWVFYDKDITRFNTFYRKHRVIVDANSSTPSNNGAPFICTSVSLNMRNMFKQIPLNGAPYPTAQYLGKYDDNIIINLEAVGLNHLKKISSMHDMLRRQAINFSSIPESWLIKIENNLINSSGNRFFAINGVDSGTIPQSPDLYSVEIRALSTSNKNRESRLSFVGATRPEVVKQSFINRLVGNGDSQSSFFEVKEVLGRQLVVVREAEVRKIAFGNSENRNLFRTYLNNIAGTLNTANSYFVDWPESIEISESLIRIPRLGSGDTVSNAFGFGGEPGGQSYIFRAGRFDQRPVFNNGQRGTIESIGAVNIPYNYFQDSSSFGLLLPNDENSEEINRAYTSMLEDPLLLMAARDLREEVSTASLSNIKNGYRRWVSTLSLDNYMTERLLLDNETSANLQPVHSQAASEGGYYRYPYIMIHRAAYAWARTINMWSALSQGHETYKSPSLNSVLQDYVSDAYDPQSPISDYQGTIANIEKVSFPMRPRTLIPFGDGNALPYAPYFYGDMEEFIGEARRIEDFLFLPRPPYENRRVSGDLEHILGDESYEEFYRIISTPEFRYGLNSFERYMWEYVGRHMIANVVDMGQIEKWTTLISNTGELVFREAKDKLDEDRINSTGPAYRDIELPLHPYWNSEISTLEPINIYTDPDFYLYSAGIDGNAETPTIEGDIEENAAEAYNRLTQIEVEMSVESINRLRVGQATAPNFDSPLNGAAPHEGESAGFNMEFGFDSYWMPRRDESSDDLSIQMVNSESVDGSTTPLGSALRHASLFTTGESPENPWTESSDENNSTGFTLEENINQGMRDAIRENPGLGGYVDWREVVPSFGLNPNFASSPPGLDRAYFNRIGSIRSSEQSPVELVSNLQNQRDLVPYNFNVEVPSGDSGSDSFISGNWGYSDVGQWSNSRTALYEKVRDGLRSIGTKKWVGRRAFPTFKIFIVEEDSIEYEWISYDDLYTYDQIESIAISDSRKRPAALATIDFLNIGGILDGHNMWKSAQSVHPNENISDAERRSLSRRQNSENGERGTRSEQNANGFVMEAGAKIIIKLGYSNNSSKLREIFKGEVTEVRFIDEGNKVSVVCQSYGTELVARAKGSNKKEVGKTYVNTFDLLAHLMFEPEVLHFGKKKRDSISIGVEDQSIEANQVIHKNTFGRGLTANFFAGVDAAFGGKIRDAVRGSLLEYINKSAYQVRIKPLDGPQDDNIYVPHNSYNQRYEWFQFSRWAKVPTSTVQAQEVSFEVNTEPREGRLTYEGVGVNARVVVLDDYAESSGDGSYAFLERLKPYELEYNVFYSTIWGVFNEMTLRHPGFVASPRNYENSTRMTMFFGLPDQRYWSKEPTLGEASYAGTLFNRMILNFRIDEEPRELDRPVAVAADLSRFMSLAERRFRPFRDWHHINSTTDIIANNMVANKYGFYTGVEVQYVGGGARRRLRRAIKRLAEEGQDSNDTVNPNGFVRFKDKHTEEMLAHRDMSTDNLRVKFHEFPNCRGRTIAKRYGRSLLARYAKEMYKGSISILGNPDIKCYDVVIVNDTFNDISGPIEVEEVVHLFSKNTGWVTEIIPDTFIIQEDITPVVMLNALRPAVMIKTEKYMEEALFTQMYDQPNNTIAVEVMNEYRLDLAREREEIQNAIELQNDLLDITFTGAGISAAGSLAAFVTLGGAATLVGAPIALPVAVAAISASMAVYAIGNYYINNYVANSKAFIMIPLIKSGKPWVAGFDLTATNSYYRGMFDVMRRWLDGGGEGINLMANDLIVSNQRIRDMLGNDLTRLAKITLRWNEAGVSFRRNLVNLTGD